MSRLRFSFLFLALTLLPALAGYAQPSPEKVVQEFAAAFNRQDLPSLLALAHPEIEWLSIAGKSLSVETEGKAALEKSLTSYFKSCPTCRGLVAISAVNGPFVSAVETATWDSKDGQKKSQKSTSIYEVTSDGLVRRVWYYPVVKPQTPTGSQAGSRRHLIYLHGRIIQDQQNPRPQHPRHGYYELAQIADAFRARGFVVTADVRPKDTTVSDGAGQIVARVRELIQSGVPADQITVVGASMGASMTMRAAARLRNPNVRFAFLGPCLSEVMKTVAAEEGNPPMGHILVVREETDVPSAQCPVWPESGRPAGTHAVEKVLQTGLGHGFLYRPLPEWVGPVSDWATRPF